MDLGQSITLLVPRRAAKRTKTWKREWLYVVRVDSPLEYRLILVPKTGIVLVIYWSRISLTCVFSRQLGGNLQCCCQVPHLNTTQNRQIKSIWFPRRTYFRQKHQLLLKGRVLVPYLNTSVWMACYQEAPWSGTHSARGVTFVHAIWSNVAAVHWANRADSEGKKKKHVLNRCECILPREIFSWFYPSVLLLIAVAWVRVIWHFMTRT